MRVILNVDAIVAPLTGIGRYALELARGLGGHPEIDALKLYSGCRWVDSPEGALRANRTIARVREKTPMKTQALEAYLYLRGLMFRWHTRGVRGWLQHSPNYILMPGDGPAVVTVHDLSHLHFPQMHPVERVRFMNRHLQRSLERAQAIIVDADAIAAELIDEFSVPSEKIHAVPLGVGDEYRPHDHETQTAALKPLGLVPGTYVLVVATLEPRKNLERLLTAFAQLPASLRRRFPLVIVGAHGWLNADLDRRMQSLQAAGELVRLGYVAESLLPLLYAGAHAFALPSLYEGFGLPLAEAMASGVPVLTSNVSALPEVAGGAALLVDPLDVEAISQGLRRLIEDESWREQARKRGFDRAAALTWSACVQGTVQVYQKAGAV